MIKTIIGLTGYAGAGKTTVANILVRDHGFEEFSFATPIKQGLALMLREFGVSLQDFEDPRRKGRLIEAIDTTPRYLMQTLGTEWGRDLIKHDLWCRLLEARIVQSSSEKIVISDVRFDDEAKMIKGIGGRVWRIERPELTASAHASEAGIDDEFVWITLKNSSSVKLLEDLVFWNLHALWSQP